MSRRYDVIVVGVGAMGAATCDQLARRGASVLGLDRYDIPNTMGAHHGHSRVIRLAYYEHADYVPLLHRAYAGWSALEAESGRRVLYMTGGLYAGEPTDDFVAAARASAVAHGLPHAYLTRPQIAERFPPFVLPDHWCGLYEPRAGLIVPERAVEAFADLARRHGAELRGNEPVLDVTRDLRVRTDQAEYQANHVVFCRGAWTRTGSFHRAAGVLSGEDSGAGPAAGVRLTVTRQVLGWVRPREPALFGADRFPVFAISHPDQSAHYGFPIVDGVPGPAGGFKIAHHWRGPVVDPEALNREPAPGDETDFRGALDRFLPQASGPLIQTRVCMYTYSPDGHFILDAHPAFGPGEATLACGFSGHGFKFAPVMGRAIADLALDGRTDLPVGFLSLKRFG